MSRERGGARWAQRRSELSGSLWVWPAVGVVIALVVGAVLAQVDVSGVRWIQPVLFPGDAVEARRLLLAIATAILGVLALVIGLTTVAIQVASNRYSPRLLRSFLRDGSVKATMAVFVGSFAFNAAGLFTVGGGSVGNDQYPRLAVTVGLATILACIASLLIFVDRMAHSIQVDTVLARVGAATIRTIERTPPGVGAGCGGVPVAAVPGWARRVSCDRAGYVQRIQRHELAGLAAAGWHVRLAVRPGDHAIRGVTLGWLWGEAPGPDAGGPEVVAQERLRAAVWLGVERSRNQDIALGIDQIVDAALLSAHVFDFHTVVQATHELAIVLERLAREPLGYQELVVSGYTIGLPGRSFADYLEQACGELRRRALGETVVYRAVLTMLGQLAASSDDPAVRAAIGMQARLLQAAAGHAVAEPQEVAEIAALAEQVAAAVPVEDVPRAVSARE